MTPLYRISAFVIDANKDCYFKYIIVYSWPFCRVVFVCLTVPVRSYHCQSSTAVCRCCLAVTGGDDQKQFVQRNRRRNALDGYLLKVVSDSRWLMKMTVETVCSRKVTLREDVLSSYEKRYGMGVPEERQRTRSSTYHTRGRFRTSRITARQPHPVARRHKRGDPLEVAMLP